jgi:hypothetical protein
MRRRQLRQFCAHAVGFDEDPVAFEPLQRLGEVLARLVDAPLRGTDAAEAEVAKCGPVVSKNRIDQ